MTIMKQNRKKKRKSFFDLTPDERDREVARFDREIDIEKETRPLTAKERALFEKMRAGKPRSVYVLPLDGKLLGQASAAARKRGMALDEFIINGIRGMIAFGHR
jgi:hypothetical protein